MLCPQILKGTNVELDINNVHAQVGICAHSSKVVHLIKKKKKKKKNLMSKIYICFICVLSRISVCENAIQIVTTFKDYEYRV